MLLFILLTAIHAQNQYIPPVFPPLTTSGNLILDSRLAPVHLHCTSWGGFHTESFLLYSLEFAPLKTLVDFVVDAGLNCVRLQFSAEMVSSGSIHVSIIYYICCAGGLIIGLCKPCGVQEITHALQH